MSALARSLRPQPGESRRLGLSVLLAAGATGAAIALLATSGYLISRAAHRPMIISLMVTITAVRAFGIARAALRYAERLASHDLALRQLARLRTTFYQSLAPLVPGQLRGARRGDLLARFVGDVDTLQDGYLRVLIPARVAVAVIAGASVAAALMLPAAGAVLAATLGTTAVLTTLASYVVAGSSARKQAPARARLTGQLVEAIDGSAELAVARRGEDYVARLGEADGQLASLARRDAAAGALASALHSLLTGAGLILVLVVGIGAVRSGSLSGVLLAAVALLFLGAYEALLPLPTAARRLEACSEAAARLDEICSERPAIADPALPVASPGYGTLAIEGVTLQYGPAEDVVLDRADLRLAPGERVALVGPSGAGKTTLAELLVRFLDPDEGRVSLGGVDVRELRQDDLRQAVLLCDQDAHLFNTTIRENLLLARRDASESELLDVLRAVELDQLDFDTRVGQQGELLSGGQRQRLALARALLSDAHFLILDEPVAHLDAPLARRVMERVLERLGSRGALVITHATDALVGFDRVVRIDRGRVRRVGPQSKGVAA
jgi:ATP-binding cassette subfamily C protein CydC